MHAPAFGDGTGGPFKLAKFLSWSSLVLILATSLFMSIFIANSAREKLLAKQREFSTLLAENLNHQIFQRFTLPTALRYGYIELSNKEQYKRMDTVVSDTIHGQHVMELRIYDLDKIVAYSTDNEKVGRADLGGAAVQAAIDTEKHSFEILTEVSALWAMFRFDMEPGTVVMRMVYPIKTERGIIPGSSGGQVTGILEFTQDITDDYKAAVNFQWVIITISFISSLILFLLLLLFIRRADDINAKRVLRMRELESDLHQAEKLASMGRVVAGIAHEIRNPLGIIQSSAELLKKKLEAEDSKQTRIVGVMFDEIKRLSQTVNDFLDYARPKKPNRVDADLAMIIDQAREFLKHEGKLTGVEIVSDYPSPMVVPGDPDLLYRALYNIIGNAMQAMEGGGTLTISGEVRRDGVTLTFADTGPGIPADIIGKLTDPFFTTKDHGTGLGLAIVANIIDSHGGSLEFANAEQGGAVVTINFKKL